MRIHHVLHYSFSPSLCLLPCLLFDHAWLMNGSLRTLSGPCGGTTLDIITLAGSQLSTLTNKHSLLTGRLQLGSLGTCHLLRRQHRPCPSTLLQSRGTHTSGHDAHTQRHIFVSGRQHSVCQPSLTLHLDASTQAVPPSSSTHDASTQLSPSVLPRRRSCSKKHPRATASCSTTESPSSPLQVQRKVAPSHVLHSFCALVCASATSWPT